MEDIAEVLFLDFIEKSMLDEYEKFLLKSVRYVFSDDDLFEHLNISEHIIIALINFDFTKDEIIKINEMAAEGALSFEKLSVTGLSEEKIAIVFYLINKSEALKMFNVCLEKFSPKRNKLSAQKKCLICMKYFKKGNKIMKFKNCMHIYDEKCILQWFQQKLSCPTCNVSLDTYKPPSIEEWCSPMAEVVMRGLEKQKIFLKLTK